MADDWRTAHLGHGPECSLSQPMESNRRTGYIPRRPGGSGRRDQCDCAACHCAGLHQPGGMHGSCQRCGRRRLVDIRAALAR